MDLLLGLLASLAVGLLIGIEREKAEKGLGIRTFPTVSLTGFIAAYLSSMVSNLIIPIVALSLGFLVAAHHYILLKKKEKGVTTETAYILSFLLGATVFYNYILAFATSVLLLLLLVSKPKLHEFAKEVHTEELLDLARFGILVAIIYPLLPSSDYSFWLFTINLREIWTMVILISVINFIGYVLMTLYGKRGLIVAGISGGMISSTAVTLSVSSEVKKDPSLYREALGAIAGATAMRNIRAILLSSIISLAVAKQIVLPLLASMILFWAYTFYIYQRTEKTKGVIPLETPFNIKEAIEFGLLYGAVKIILQVLNKIFGSIGIILTALFTGFTDVDAITLSLSKMYVEGSILITLASLGILIAVVSNDFIKGAYTFLGGKNFGKKGISLLILFNLPIILYILYNFLFLFQ